MRGTPSAIENRGCRCACGTAHHRNNIIILSLYKSVVPRTPCINQLYLGPTCHSELRLLLRLQHPPLQFRHSITFSCHNLFVPWTPCVALPVSFRIAAAAAPAAPPTTEAARASNSPLLTRSATLAATLSLKACIYT